MSHDPGPWRSEPPHAPPPPRNRLVLWLVIAAAIGALVLALARAFPEASLDGGDWANVAYLGGLLLLIAAGASRLRRGALGQHLRHAAIWAAIVATLALGLAYRAELAGVGQRLQMAFRPGAPVATAAHELVIPQNDEGGFVIVGAVNGQKVKFVVDTGATETVLSPADARRLGVPVDDLRYDDTSETANGVGHSARYTAQRLEVGPVKFDDFEMAINQTPMSGSLLGMSFLSRLQSFEFRGRTLILKWRDADN